MVYRKVTATSVLNDTHDVHSGEVIIKYISRISNFLSLHGDEEISFKAVKTCMWMLTIAVLKAQALCDFDMKRSNMFF